jgi:hypothetical protein
MQWNTVVYLLLTLIRMTGVVYDSLDLEQVEIKMTSSKIGLKFQVRPQKLS